MFCHYIFPTHLVLVGLPFLIPLPPWCSVTTFSPPTWSLLDSLSSFPCPYDVLSLLFPHPPGPCWTPFPHSPAPMMFCHYFFPTHLVLVGLPFLFPLPLWCSVTTFSPPTWSLLDSLSSFLSPHDVLSLLYPHPPGLCWTRFPRSLWPGCRVLRLREPGPLCQTGPPSSAASGTPGLSLWSRRWLRYHHHPTLPKGKKN